MPAEITIHLSGSNEGYKEKVAPLLAEWFNIPVTAPILSDIDLTRYRNGEGHVIISLVTRLTKEQVDQLTAVAGGE